MPPYIYSTADNTTAAAAATGFTPPLPNAAAISITIFFRFILYRLKRVEFLLLSIRFSLSLSLSFSLDPLWF